MKKRTMSQIIEMIVLFGRGTEYKISQEIINKKSLDSIISSENYLIVALFLLVFCLAGSRENQ
jgi:hypothetical protein